MSFAAPLLLAGLVAIGIPLILHLMSKDIPKVVHFSTLRFIRKDKLETHSRRGVRDLLLLLMRCLLIAALVFAFSRPFFEEEKAAAAEVQQQTIVLLDVSASMNRKGIQEKVRELLDKELTSGEAVALISSGDGLLRRSTFETKSILFEQLKNVKFTYHQGRHEESLNEAAAMFAEDATDKKIIVVSDFQVHDWKFLQTPQVGKEITLKFISPFDSELENISVLVNKVRRLNDGKIVQVQVMLENFSSQEKDIEVQFTYGLQVSSEKVSLTGREKRRLILTLKDPSASKATVSITADDYPADDVYHLWIGKEAPVTVLFPRENTNDLDYFFIEKALQAVTSGDASFRIDAHEVSTFSKAKLDSYQVVILNDSAAKLNTADFERLKIFVKQGGLIVAAPADKGALLFSKMKAYGLADISFKSMVRRKNSSDLPFNFTQMAEDSDLLKIFKNTPDSDLQNFAIYRYNSYKTGQAARHILSIKPDTPGWSLFENGQGQVLVSAIPFNHVWSDFTLSNSFLPLLRHSLISLSNSDSHSIVYLNVGERRQKPVISQTVETAAENFVNTSQAGSQEINEVPYVTNISRLESSTDKVNIINLKSQISNSKAARVTVKGEKQAASEYWHYFIMIALAALLLEFALADMFGKKA
ncbi:MAG: BatA domain-containing protein [Lentisphaeraceae bacterium]|nr:BatA domain-containing protein [Lentisphaeraceae bacterium]